MMLSLRRTLIACGLLVVMFACAFHSAKATFDEQALASSRSLFTFLEPHGPTRTLLVNGARLDLDSGRSDLSLGQVLDEAAKACVAASGGIAARVTEIQAALPKASLGLTDGILRVERGQQGLVACLTLSDLRLSLEELEERFRAFARDGDLAQLGGIQLVRAEQQENSVFFVTVRSVGPLPLWRMFPEHGDAPGVDFAEAPRIEGSRRVFSTWQKDGAPALNIYETDASVEQSYERQATSLVARGYRISGQTKISEARRAGLLVKGAEAVVLAAEPSASGSMLTLMPLSKGPGIAAAFARASEFTAQ